MESIALFTRIADLAGVVQGLREIAPVLNIDGTDETWRKAVVVFGSGNETRTLTFHHDPDYYSEPNWSNQMSGMRGLFSRFPDSDRKPRMMMLTSTFKFLLGTVFEPEYDPEGDERLTVLFRIAELLDGVLFVGTAMLDAHGRTLLSAHGMTEEDPDAVWPRVAAEVSIASPVGAAAHAASRPRPPQEEVETDETPTAVRVARRALALTAVTARAVLDQDTASPQARRFHGDLMAWVRDISIDDEFEPEEWEMLHQPLGQIAQQQQLNSFWRLEGLAVLAWALGRFEIPPYDQMVAFGPLWKSLGFRDGAAAKALLAHPELRLLEEIGTLRNRLFALHWRLRDFQVNPKIRDFAQFAPTCRFGPLDISDACLVDGDLGLRGERIDRASREIFSSTHSSVQERHQAANWLREGPERYSEASVAT